LGCCVIKRHGQGVESGFKGTHPAPQGELGETHPKKTLRINVYLNALSDALGEKGGQKRKNPDACATSWEKKKPGLDPTGGRWTKTTVKEEDLSASPATKNLAA